MQDLLPFAIIGLYAVFAVWDFVRPARKFVKMPYWRLKGVAFFAMSLVVSSMTPLLTDEFLAQYQLVDASGLGIVGGAVVGLLVLQFVSYWWHRALHRFQPLWRFHQMHHSAERIDIFGAMYFHPFDVVGFTVAGSVALVLLVGVPGEAALIAGVTSSCIAIFGHANVKTPRWLGYILQRPENHARHHERGLHARNYGDISIWDMVFGTFENPETWNGKAGFYDGASRRVGALLLMNDVTKEPEKHEPVPSSRAPLTA